MNYEFALVLKVHALGINGEIILLREISEENIKCELIGSKYFRYMNFASNNGLKIKILTTIAKRLRVTWYGLL